MSIFAPEVPKALAHGPGRWGAVVVADGTALDLRATARKLLDKDDARILVAVSSFVAENTAASLVRVDDPFAGTHFPVGRPGLFVQVSADARAIRDELLHAVKWEIARQGNVVVEEHALAAIEPGAREPFGFPDPFRPKKLDHAFVREGLAQGCAVLLYQHWHQDIARFTALPTDAQERVMGIHQKDGKPLVDAPKTAHVLRMRASDYALVRRGLPLEDRTGLLVVAHARAGATLSFALRSLTAGDALVDFAWPVSGGAFIALSSSASLSLLSGSVSPDSPSTPHAEESAQESA